jgi:adenylylsulfate kinase
VDRGSDTMDIWMIDTRRRSIIKSLSWRLLGFLSLLCCSYFITTSATASLSISILHQIVTLFVYIYHERFWAAVRWGRTKGISIQMTGLSGSGKTTLAQETAKRLRKKGYLVEVIDGDEYRENLCKDLGFSKEDRNNNIRRLSFVSKVLARNNVISIIAAINPYEEIRVENQQKDSNIKTVYVKCDIDTVKKRDVKGLYVKALLPDGHPDKIYNFTGISDPFEDPGTPDLIINTAEQTLPQCVIMMENFILRNTT